MKDILGFSRTKNMRRVMSVNGFFASIMRTEKKKEGSNKELPPGLPIPVLPVDYLNVRPDDWIGGAGSYVVPVQPDWALWFNWTMNNPAETSILASVKGMNPLTGQSFEDFKLDKFEEKCPVHGCDFHEGRMCPECGFKWPAQNFYSNPNPLYCDGFLQPNGEVRQFYFTEDMQKSIPDIVIGQDKTVPAFGFCFYKVKKPKNNYEACTTHKNEFPKWERTNNPIFGGLISGDSSIYDIRLGGDKPFGSSWRKKSLSRGISMEDSMDADREYGISSSAYYGASVSNTSSLDTPLMVMNCSYAADDIRATSKLSASLDSFADVPESDMYKSVDMEMNPANPDAVIREVGVGAGAAIEQKFVEDKRKIDTWNDDPGAVMRLYFVFQDEFESYASHGLKDLNGAPEGYLAGLPKGGSDE